jgi:RNA-directed DNA polymerase
MARTPSSKFFFGDDVKSITLGGKKFNSGKIDEQTEYGKMRFATRVVEPRAERIDFSGFRPLLENISAAIAEYYEQAEARVALG